MLPAGFKSPSEVLDYYDGKYFDLIDSGKAHPFIYPWASLGAAVVILYLLIDHRSTPLLKKSRYLVFALLCYYQGWCLLTNRARNPASSFGVGLISAYGTLVVAAHIIANDCQVDYRRLERRRDDDKVLSASKGTTEHEMLNSDAGTLVDKGKDTAGLMYWQSYPSTSFYDRIDWVVDMFISFRGVGWSWQTSGLPDLPVWVSDQLANQDTVERNESVKSSRTGIRLFTQKKALIRDTVPKIIIGYLALDALKTLAMNDPYFWGYTDAPPPAHYPDIVRHSPTLTKSTRLLITLTSVYTALWTIYKLGPVFFAGIIGTRWLGLRGEAWMNPADFFGSFTLVLDKGLSGWWGGWWHQTFRYAFEAPTTKILSALKIDKRSKVGNMLSLFIAFFLSGCLHACGSYTQLGDTRPIRGPMSFFLLQAVGIAIEQLSSDATRAAGIKLPQALQRLINTAFVLFWLYHTAPLLADDFSQGGVWLFEPVPISIFRGLGMGPADSDWFCWRGGIAWWRIGGSIFTSGIAL